MIDLSFSGALGKLRAILSVALSLAAAHASAADAKKAFVIVEITVKDAARYSEYAQRSAPAVEAFGGRYIALGQPEALEGEPPAQRIAIVEFESREKAFAFYHSAEYQAARAYRIGAAEVKMSIVSERK